MADNYFGNLQTVGATLDEGIAKLQEVWKMPHLLLYKDNEQDKLVANQLVDKLREELRLLKGSIAENKVAVANLKETHSQFVEESTQAIRSLKEEVDDIKTLFVENGYVEEPIEQDFELNLSVLNSQLESLSVSNSTPVRNAENITDSSMCNNASGQDSLSMTRDYDAHVNTPNASFSSGKKSLLSERPIEPNYSPYYYKIMKK